MAIVVTFNGQTYSVPERREVGWSSLTNYLVALQDAAVAGGPLSANLRISNTTPITFLSTDYTVVADLSVPGAVAVAFPAGVNEKLYMVVDGTGDAATNNITITPDGSETIGDAATFVMNENNMAVLFQYSSSTSNWYVVGVWKKNILTRTSVDQAANRVLNKDFDDATTFVVDSADTSKKLTFSTGGATASTTTTLAAVSTTSKTLTLPDITDTLVTRTSTDTGANRLQNKDLDDESTNIVDTADTTKKINFEPGGQSGTTVTTFATTSTTSKTITFPDVTDQVVTRTSTDTLTNKTLTAPVINSPTGITKGDVGLGNVDNTSDATKNAAAVSLTNHTIDGDLNTVQDLGITSLKTVIGQATTFLSFDGAGAPIATKAVPTGVVVGTTDSQVLTGKTLTGNIAVNLVSGAATVTLPTTTSSLATLALSENLTNKNLASSTNTLTGATAGSFTNTGTVTLFTATDTVVGKATADVLTNKDIDGGTASNTLRITMPKNTTANLAALTRKEGTIVYDTDLDVIKYDNGATLSILSTSATATSLAAGLVTSFDPIVQSNFTTITNADATVTDTDGFSTFYFSTGNTGRTLTLPTAADNDGRSITVKKTDSGTGTVTVDGESSETIDGALTFVINQQYSFVKLSCNGANWFITDNGTQSETVISSTYTTTHGSSAQQFDGTSITVPVGFWRLTHQSEYKLGTAVGVTSLALGIGISTTSGNSITGLIPGENRLRWISSIATITLIPFNVQTFVTVTSPTVYYAKCQSPALSSGDCEYNGVLSAQRIK